MTGIYDGGSMARKRVLARRTRGWVRQPSGRAHAGACQARDARSAVRYRLILPAVEPPPQRHRRRLGVSAVPDPLARRGGRERSAVGSRPHPRRFAVAAAPGGRRRSRGRVYGGLLAGPRDTRALRRRAPRPPGRQGRAARRPVVVDPDSRRSAHADARPSWCAAGEQPVVVGLLGQGHRAPQRARPRA